MHPLNMASPITASPAASLPRRLLLRAAALALAAGALWTVAPPVHAATPVKFVLDWKLQGVHAWYYLARDRGYFTQEGIDITIDQGSGSAAAVTNVMSGSYQAGFGDMNAIIQSAAQKPGEAPVMVYMVYSRTPFALMTKAGSPIKTLKDVEGRKLGSPAGGAAAKVFPVLAEKNGVDASKVSWLNMAPNLQEQMLLQGQVDASVVFSVTSYLNLMGQRVDPDKDIRWFHYADHGIDLYSNGVLVSRKLVREQPAAVRGLVRAIHRGVLDTIRDPDAAIAALAKAEPLINKDLEKKRLLYALKQVVMTSEAASRGIGDVDDARLRRSMDQLEKAFGLAAKPPVGEVFDRSFLPPRAERTLPAAAGG
jgi:NitT/TauT family transport system substrate-binding protein